MHHENVAVNKPAYQISTAGSAFASHAVDGSKDTTNFIASCTHTAFETSPWWMLDLGRKYRINYVTYTNRITWGKYLYAFKIPFELLSEDVLEVLTETLWCCIIYVLLAVLYF